LTDFSHFEASSASEILSWALATYGDSFAIASSLQKEGMVILDVAAGIAPGRVRVFTLDTGRLPQETHDMIETVRRRYGIDFEMVFPAREEVERMVSGHGPNLFYDSVQSRQLCCEIRKVRPMARKLRTLRAWATGLRRSQSETRAGVPKVEEADGRIKISPLADWSAEQVDQYIREHDVPVHPLYARGYTSIGCAPCTRAVGADEAERAGRWWWEEDARKECGIHFAADGSVTRHA
jgi:phosphoadenylyl-sulfate reductase (thioredoxin)